MADGSLLDSAKNFARTSTGRVAIAVAAVAIALAVAALLYVYTAGGQKSAEPAGSSTVNKPAGTMAKGAAGSGTESSATAEQMEPPVAVDSFSQEQFRDPFRPIDESATTSVLEALQVKIKDSLGGRSGTGSFSASGPGTGSSGGGSLVDGTLKLVSITESDGKKTATVSFGGKNYAVGVGDRIDGSSYQVVGIGADSIELLYGDDRLTLTIGESISK